MYQEIVEQQDNLQDLFDEVKRLQKDKVIGDYLLAQFVWYLCVRTSGYVENAVELILLKYVQSKTLDIPTQNFAKANLTRIAANYGSVIGLVTRFSDDWKVSLRERNIQDYKPALDNMVKNRNHIAHGRDVNITLQEMQGYFRDAQKVVELLHQTCDPQNGPTAEI